MCGLAGVAALGGHVGVDAAVTAEAMAATLRHRGPDGSGSWSDARVALAHRRLAILDLTSAGSQPMVSAGGRYVVVFNGEVYNYRDLGARLATEGWRSRGNSDTEVLLAAVEAWGLDRFLERADGMFAFALYDRAEARLFLARDRFGEKPLAYCVHRGQLYFASELRAFAEVPGLDMSLDAATTASYFRFGYVPGTATIHAAISRVAPATVVEIDLAGDGVQKERAYWEVPSPAAVPERRRQDRDEELLALLSASVRDRLVSDRPVGAFLSGGIDSSLVCALAAGHTTGALQTFTMGWGDVEYDESRQAARVAAALGADHHDVRLDRADVVRAVDRLGSVMDEPFADSSQLAVLLVAAHAREKVVVALSGDGGDELFAGYNRHRWLLGARAVQRRVPGRARQAGARLAHRSAPLIEAALRPIPPTRRPRLVADKVRKLSNVIAASSLLDSYEVLLAGDTTIGADRQLAPGIRSALSGGERDAVLWALRSADIAGYLPDDILTKVDRATMAVSLESRSPFLNADLAEVALGLGAGQLLGRSGGKQPLRSLLRTLLPGVAFNQTKAGFGIPVAGLLRGELHAGLREAIAEHLARRAPVPADWTNLCSRLTEGDDAPAPLLWSLLMFELWAREVKHSVSWR